MNGDQEIYFTPNASVISRPGQSQGLLYQHRLIHYLTHLVIIFLTHVYSPAKPQQIIPGCLLTLNATLQFLVQCCVVLPFSWKLAVPSLKHLAL